MGGGVRLESENVKEALFQYRVFYWGKSMITLKPLPKRVMPKLFAKRVRGGGFCATDEPFVSCDFCGHIFDYHFDRYCPRCLDRVQQVKDLLHEQYRQEKLRRLERFLAEAVIPKTEYAFSITSIEPVFEIAVRELFAQRAKDLGYEILESRNSFPDYVLRHEKGIIRAEVELTSSNFKLHRHDPQGCDLIICWKHDWNDCPLAVLALEN